MPRQLTHITFFYGALFGLLFVALSVRTLRLRGKLGIAIGDAGNQRCPQNIARCAYAGKYRPAEAT